jgi:hypothetical protein
MTLTENWQELARFYSLFFFGIAVAGTLVAEAVKKIYKGIKKFKTGDDTVKFNPIVLYIIVGVFDVVASIIFALLAKAPTWALALAPIAVFVVSIVGYDTIVKNVIDTLELLGVILKRFITGNKKEVMKDEGEIKRNGFGDL